VERRLADTTSETRYIRRVALTLGLAALAAFLWFAREPVLLIFGGVLVAVVLAEAAERISKWSGLPRAWALSIAALFLVAVAGAALWLFGSQIGGQFAQLAVVLPETIKLLRNELADTGLGRMILWQAENGNVAAAGGAVANAFADAVRSILEGLGSLLLALFAGIYFAAQPDLYRKGLIKLVPPSRRQRASDVLGACGVALRHWLLGQLAAMTIVGFLTGVGLWLLDVPSALALALIAAFAEFVPIVGPIFAAIPAMLLALSTGPEHALYVGFLYLAIQQVESYVLYPLIQEEAVALPPVLTLFMIVAFSIVLGPLALIFATPLTVVLIVLVRMLYVEDTLGDRRA
jgi:predicted PurR-regulated permease PerM